MRTEDERRAATRRRYGLQERLPLARDAETVFVSGFLLPQSGPPGWRLVKTCRPEAVRETLRLRWILERQPGEALDLVLHECPSRTDAVEAFVAYAATCAGPPFEPAKDHGLELGEAAWVGPAGAPSSILFVRGNVLVILRPALGRPDAREVASWLDHELSGRPGAGSHHGEPRPVIKRFAVGGPFGDGLLVDLEVGDPAGRPFWVKFLSAGGSLARTQGRIVFRPWSTVAALEAFAVTDDDRWAGAALAGEK